ncbi:aminodeoxychorismate synthase component 1 [Acerihabitans arboris]|uniref:aminodeoxychorismate synthase n=1 Tax=Acerihabitans arboris TaxID=2691583 RepID=A0A845SHS0_9GAMM|nr:aminodeoxychorismate synthase component 1 [Acerihabitans arboris]NDL62494.1 aminodeoxychorismate synthase component 1 [Acerihabitans arboris]
MLPQLTALPYHRDAIKTLFAPRASRPWSMLLHSGHADHQDSRFDIMVANPVTTLMTHGATTVICRGGESVTSGEDPFTLVQQQVERLGVSPGPRDDLPFLGGALGLFGYDLGRRIETLPSAARRDLTLPDMAVGLYDWAVIADHLLGRLTLVSYRDPAPLLRNLMSPKAPAPGRPFRLNGGWQANMTREEYGEKFRRIQQHLQAGDCYQVCLAQRFSAACEGDEWQAFCHLLERNGAPFSAFIRLPGQAVLSLSPERFLQVRGRRIQTRPIKGTLPRLADARADLLQGQKLAASPKDQAENLMIVDLLRNDIGRVAVPGSVRVPELFKIEAFPAVYHMVSTITALLPADRAPCDLLRACFPGGSITGAPKIKAMTLIDRLEPERRNAWCGSIGYLSRCGSLDTNIAIRTLLTERGRIYCWAGGGIVADSQEEAEYQETLAKVAKILPLLLELNRP